MQEDRIKARQEQHVLKLSIGVTLCIAVFGIVMGIVTGAASVIFDGVYSAMDCLFTMAALGVARLIQIDTTAEQSRSPVFAGSFQSGFWHLEPMLLAVNGIALMIAVFYGVMEAVTIIWHGVHVPAFGNAVFFAITMVIVCYGFALYEMRVNRGIRSAFISIDIKSWIISGGISIALLIAFVFALLFENTAADWLIPYIDPAVLVIICLIMAPMPIRIVINAMQDIFLVTPHDIDAHVTRIVDAVVERYGFVGSQTYVAKVGRSIMIEVHLILPEHYKIGTVDWLDRIRGEIGDAIGGGGPDRWFTVCFTAKPEWV